MRAEPLRGLTRRPALLLLCAAVLPVVGCYASNVVAERDRGVVLEQPALAFTAAISSDLPGFYASVEVEGDAAGALLRAYYYLSPHGTYSGGALVVSEGGPQFLVIAEQGQWTFDETGLDLHDGSPPVEALVAPEHLKLVSAESAITFQRVELR